MTAMLERITQHEALSTIAPEFPSAVGESAHVLFDQTVPRHLVHRAAVSEVLLTDLRVTGDTTFQVGAQWPRDHSFFRVAAPGYHDPMLFAETFRQATLVIAHQVFNVPLDWSFLTMDKHFWIDPDGLRMGRRPADILLSVTCHDIKLRGNTVSGMRTEFGCYRDGVRIGTGEIGWSCVSPAVYKRLRAGKDPASLDIGLPVPVAPRTVGRERARDVVLTPIGSRDSWQLRYDLSHPVMFDHLVDHVPGMVMMEAARQAATVIAGRTDVLPVGCRFFFDHYVELDSPTVLTALEAPSQAGLGVNVVLDQDGRRVAHGTIDMAVTG